MVWCFWKPSLGRLVERLGKGGIEAEIDLGFKGIDDKLHTILAQLLLVTKLLGQSGDLFSLFDKKREIFGA